MHELKNCFKRNISNALGWRTKRKIIVFESDDWGTIRMPGKATYNLLRDRGLGVEDSLYDRFDTLENKEDFDLLLNVLSNYHNAAGKCPKLTLNTVLNNPDFEKIQAEKFNKYYSEDLFASYKRYYGEDLFPLWISGMNKGLIKPQFHAREHLNVPLWMRDLNRNNSFTRLAFDHGFFGLKTRTSSVNQNNYLAAYRAETTSDFNRIKNITKDGLSQFEQLFDFTSKSFIGANYIWPKELESVLKQVGVQYIQSQRSQIAPVLDENKVKIYRHYFGQKNNEGQRYLLRNVHFEPYLNQERDWVNDTMKEIQNAFFWKKPAIISTHRINYVSNMSVKHRDASLKKLDQLLSAVIKKWPDVQFMSSDQLGNYCFKSK